MVYISVTPYTNSRRMLSALSPAVTRVLAQNGLLIGNLPLRIPASGPKHNLLKADVLRVVADRSLLLPVPRTGPEILPKDGFGNNSHETIPTPTSPTLTRFVTQSIPLPHVSLGSIPNILAAAAAAALPTVLPANAPASLRCVRYSSTNSSEIPIINARGAPSTRSKTPVGPPSPSDFARMFATIQSSKNTTSNSTHEHLLLRDTTATAFGPGFLDPILLDSHIAIINLIRIRPACPDDAMLSSTQINHTEPTEIFDLLSNHHTTPTSSSSIANVTSQQTSTSSTVNTAIVAEDLFDILTSKAPKSSPSYMGQMILDFEIILNKDRYDSKFATKFITAFKKAIEALSQPKSSK